MKTIVKVFFTLFVMTSSLMLISCKDEDEDKSPAIVGAWVTEPFLFEEDNPDLMTSYLWYKSDGSFIEVDVIYDPENPNRLSYEHSDTGKWTVDGDYITQTYNFQWDDPEEFDTDIVRFDVKGDILILSVEYAGIYKSIQLKRIKEDKMQEVYNAAKEYYHKLYPNK
ncbi:MAG: hypothetical protein IKX59_03995 [Bacteroidales bacterium]|nr:hypothetical protein [Bacteroidales bacterium]